MPILNIRAACVIANPYLEFIPTTLILKPSIGILSSHEITHNRSPGTELAGDSSAFSVKSLKDVCSVWFLL